MAVCVCMIFLVVNYHYTDDFDPINIKQVKWKFTHITVQYTYMIRIQILYVIIK